MIKNYCTGLQHIGIPTDNVEKTMEFYQSLGFSTAHMYQKDDLYVVFMKMENLILELYASEEAGKRLGVIDHIAIDVTDIEECFAEIIRMGYTIVNNQIEYLPFWDHGIKYFTTIGYNGEKIEFSQIL